MQNNGRVIGTGEHQRVQELLLRLPEATKDKALGDSLISLFARNPNEQRELNKAFAEAIARTNLILAPASAPDDDPAVAALTEEEKKQARRDRRNLLLATIPILLLIIGAIAYLLAPKERYTGNRTLTLKVQQEVELTELDSLTSRIGKLSAYDTSGFDGPVLGEIRREEDQVFYTAGGVGGQDSLRINYEGTWNQRMVIIYHIRVDTLVPKAIDTTAIGDIAEGTLDYQPLPIPFPNSLADLRPPPSETTVFDRLVTPFWWWWTGVAYLLLLVFSFFLLRFLHRRRQRLVARKERLAGTPHFWRIQLPGTTSLVDFGEDYPLLLRRLRQRREGDHHKLDLNATIDATIASGGLPQFRYRGTTRPAEYLLLIDRGGADNHRAQLFELLYQRLLEEEVLIERYFYDGDPRLLYQQDRAVSTTLPRLRQRFPDAALVMVGTGDRLLNAANGRISNWASKQLKAWGQPSLLSPRYGATGRRERQLSELFTILPATVTGLSVLAENKGRNESQANKPLQTDAFADAAKLTPVRFSGDLVSSLKQYYTAEQVKWVAACALYPSLHWELTLFLGEKISASTGQNLLGSHSLLELCRLPWFVQGSIPDPAREVLAEWLEAEHPELYLNMRAALLAAMDKAPPPANSAAARDLDFQRAQNEWVIALPGSPEKKRAANKLREHLRAGRQPDVTTVKFLQKTDRLDQLLPDSVKRYLYAGGYRGVPLDWERMEIPLMGLLHFLPFFILIFAVFRPDGNSDGCRDYLIESIQNVQIPGDVFIDMPLDTVTLCSREDSLNFENIIHRTIINRVPWSNELLEDTTGYLVNLNNLNQFAQPLHGILPLRTILFSASQDSLLQLQKQKIAAALFNKGLAVRDTTRQTDSLSCACYLAAARFDQESSTIQRYVEACTLNETSNSFVADRLRNLREALLAQQEALSIFMPQYLGEVSDMVDQIDYWSVTQFDRLDAREYSEIDFEGGDELLSRTNELLRQLYQRTTQTAVPTDTTSRTVVPIDEDTSENVEEVPEIPTATPSVIDNVSAPQMLVVPGGIIQMGDTFGDTDREGEKPVHTVSVYPFSIGSYEVTFAEYDRFTEATGKEAARADFGREQQPVVNVSWFDAISYANWLSVQLGYTSVYRLADTERQKAWVEKGYGLELANEEAVLIDWSANGYRLPTEAEWEYAASYVDGNRKARFGNGQDILRPEEVNFDASEEHKEEYSKTGINRRRTVAVGALNSPNNLGIHDLSGNVWEWCSDWYGENYYSSSQGANNPTGPNSGVSRVLRGGAWNFSADYSRVAPRFRYRPWFRVNYCGFRLARSTGR